MSNIDLSNPPPNHKYKVSVEREETRGELAVRLIKDMLLFLAGLGFVGLIVWLCTTTVFSATATMDEKKWAMSVLSAMAGGIVGYLIRR